jgi:predicted Fe-Mo cluster-binding NifX family protein
MKIAVTYENGQVFQHFGHTEQFKLYEVNDGEITNATIVPTLGSGHGALAGFLKAQNVDTLICGGIGAGAKTALADAGIILYGGVTGSADDAVKAFLDKRLHFNANIECHHHDHEDHGTCGEHGCGHSH